MSAFFQYPLRIVAVAALLTGLLLTVWSLANPPQLAPEPLLAAAPLELLDVEASDDLPDAPMTPREAEYVIVYISGAVRAPDVYRLPEQARIKDAVLAAGGFADDADPERINLAEPLSDSQHIAVPRRGETDPPPDSLPADQPDSSGLLDLNRVTQADLEELPGVGPALAVRIIEFRDTDGPFTSVEQLRDVKGIGPALFDKIAPLVTVE